MGAASFSASVVVAASGCGIGGGGGVEDVGGVVGGADLGGVEDVGGVVVCGRDSLFLYFASFVVC